MPVVGVRELKAHASAILRKVRDEGEEYVVTFHGRPVGMLIPVNGDIVEAGTVSAARAVAQTQVSEGIIEEVAEQTARRRSRPRVQPATDEAQERAPVAAGKPQEPPAREAPQPAPSRKPVRPRRPATAGRRRAVKK